MPRMDWQRLAQAVIDRRVELGHRTRGSFAAASQLSARLINDIELAKRDNYDRVTFARLEQALEWPSGLARAILTNRDVSARAQVAEANARAFDVRAVTGTTAFGTSAHGHATITTSMDVIRALNLDDVAREDLIRALRQALAALDAAKAEIIETLKAAGAKENT